MNTTAQIARLDAEADELEAQAWDKRAEADRAIGYHNLATRMESYAITCRARAADYLMEAGPNLALSNHPTNEAV